MSSGSMRYFIPALIIISSLSHHTARSQAVAPEWATTNRVVPSCTADADTCEFDLHVDFVVTMAHPHEQNGTVRVSPVYITEEGQGYRRQRPGCESVNELTELELLQSNIMDGTRKIAKGVNGHIPGIPIVVYEGQKVVIKVTNHLDGHSITMHWHGIHQRGTPYMDGTGGVSQCPIDDGQSFTYRFIANPVGTHWYHSHMGYLRSEGVYGAFIVLPRPQAPVPSLPSVPVFDDEFIMTVSDFFHQSSEEVALQWIRDIGLSTSHSSYEDCYIGRTPAFVSGVVNGKGRYYPNNTGIAFNPGVPLEKFHVEVGKKYRFRMINAALETSFKVSVDGHPIHIIASDGMDVEELTVDHFIISPAESYDFYMDTIDPQALGNYYIRVTATAKPYLGLQPEGHLPGHTEAILHYVNAPETQHPVSIKRQCTAEEPCTTFNCPQDFENPVASNDNCLPISTLRSVPKPSLWVEGAPVSEHFFNMRFVNGTRADSIFKAGINGIKHVNPPTPPMTYPPYDFIDRPCEEEDCSGEVCTCNHIVKVPLGSNVQITLLVQGPTFTAPLATHPIHMHGQHFQIVKMGFPTYDPLSGGVGITNPDISCLDKYCNNVTWADPTWGNGNLPDLLDAPPMKDSVAVPAGGYVVVRFRADNPGYWYMHCHMEYHNHDGMALVLQVGEVDEMPPLPTDFKRCGSFDFPATEFTQIYSLPNVPAPVLAVPAAVPGAAVLGAAAVPAAETVPGLKAQADGPNDTPSLLLNTNFLHAMVALLVCLCLLLGGACLLLLGHQLRRGSKSSIRYVFIDEKPEDPTDTTKLLGSL